MIVLGLVMLNTMKSSLHMVSLTSTMILGDGFRKIVIKPEPAGDLKWARGSYLSSQGKIESDWKLENNRFTLKLTVPVNTSATVYIPGESIDSILEGERQASRSDQVSYQRKERDRYVFTVGSGSYQFTSQYHSQ